MLDINSKDRSERIAARAVLGRPPKYNIEVHAPLLIDIFSKGGEVCHFCSRVEIGRAIFYKWVADRPEFARTYDVARELAYEHWIGLMPEDMKDEEGKKFNYKVWQIIMKNRFGLTDQRKICLPKLKTCKTPEEKMTCIVGYIGDGELTTQELSHLSNLILASLKIDQNTTLEGKVDELEQAIKILKNK